ncbi:hypothetical protein PtB15_8B129 [Puccinia triticina]|nr:hypothetical protein PtB15_8B129 [Puccinia triticina]
MDLSTMVKKLDKGVYKRHSELMADFELIVSNCVQFNGADSQLGLEAKALKKVWDLEWEKAANLIPINDCSWVYSISVELVDPVKYQITTYFAVVGGQQNARDLGTIKANLVADRYNSIGEPMQALQLSLHWIPTNHPAPILYSGCPNR